MGARSSLPSMLLREVLLGSVLVFAPINKCEVALALCVCVVLGGDG